MTLASVNYNLFSRIINKPIRIYLPFDPDDIILRKTGLLLAVYGNGIGAAIGISCGTSPFRVVDWWRLCNYLSHLVVRMFRSLGEIEVRLRTAIRCKT